MANQLSKESALNFVFRDAVSATKIYEILKKAIKTTVYLKERVFERHKIIKEVSESVVDESRSERLSTSTNHQHYKKYEQN